jgi:hypothetical protein
MDVGVLNPYVMKIMISARSVDTISAISTRIGLSYGWTYKWMMELEKLEVFRKAGKKVFLNEDSPFYGKTLAYLKNILGKDVGFYYQVLDFFGLKYCFTATDAVFFWTDGGYNIGRYSGHYPIFIKVKESDKKVFKFYIEKLGLKGDVFYQPIFLEDFEISMHRGIPVDRLDETVDFMKKYIYNFEPALEMIQDMYGKEMGIRYREAVTNV